VLRVPRPLTVAVLMVMFVVVGVGVFATVAVGEQGRRPRPAPALERFALEIDVPAAEIHGPHADDLRVEARPSASCMRS